MREPVFTGVCPAVITPFDSCGAVNYDAFKRQIERQIRAGVDAICVCGTTGEASTLSKDEHFSVIECCVKTVNHRVKVIAGAGSNCTSTALELSQQAEDAGADALLLVTPYYNKTSQNGLIKHYEYIADRVSLPIILYNVPSRTGLSFSAETYKILSAHPQINGTKEASGNFSLVNQTRMLCGDDLNIWSGNDDQIVPLMSLGAKGVISVACNAAPELMHRITHDCLNGDFTSAAKAQIESWDFISSLFCEVNPIPIKCAMNILGNDAGSLRLPLSEISDANFNRLKTAMSNLGLITT